MAEKEKGPCPANDKRSPSAEPLDPRIRRIAEAIGRPLARRISFRLPLMTINQGDDGHIGNGISKTGLGLCESATRSSDKAHACHRRRVS